MRVRPLVLLTVLVFAIAPACGSSPRGNKSTTTGVTSTTSTTTATAPTTTTALPSASTGVRGQVTAGPTCPVERADQPCPPRPVDGRVDALTGGGTLAGSAHTDAEGRYAISLASGDYTLRVDTGGAYPRCSDVSVHVTSGAPAIANMNCDTGIR